MTYRIAFIGFGTIVQDVVRSLSAQAYTFAAMRRDGAALPQPGAVHSLADMQALLAWQPDLVVEAASQQAVWTLVPDCLAQGVPVLVTSVGALADSVQFARLSAAAQTGRARLSIPAGAVASLDYLQAVRGVPGASVHYESRKPVAAWLDELARLGVDPATLAGPLVLFEGSARDAALRYPKNLNVAATVALAGVGMAATQVSVIVDPAATGNTHTIRVNGPLGRLETCMSNAPSPGNPKTSWVVAQSLVSAIERQFASFTIA